MITKLLNKFGKRNVLVFTTVFVVGVVIGYYTCLTMTECPFFGGGEKPPVEKPPLQTLASTPVVTSATPAVVISPTLPVSSDSTTPVAVEEKSPPVPDAEGVDINIETIIPQ